MEVASIILESVFRI